MLAPSVAYADENAKLSRTPILRLEFVRDSVSLAKLSTLLVPDNPEWLPYIESVQGLESHVEAERGRTAEGLIVVTLTDISGDITRLLSGDGIGGATVIFQKGFDSIADEEFQTFRTGTVESGPRLTADLLAYEVTIRSAQSQLNRSVFAVASSPLSIDLANGDTTELFVDDASGFLDSGYVRIDDEYIQYSAKTPTSLTGLTRGLALGSTITEDVDHAAGVSVQEVLRLGPAHPIDIRVAVLTNTDKTGLSIDPALVDIVTHDAVKALIGALEMEWLIDAVVPNAADWIEQEIDSFLGLYARTTGDGMLSIVNSIEPSASVATLDHDNIIELGNPPWDQNLESVVNVVAVYADHDAIAKTGEDGFKSSLEIPD